MLHFEVEFSYHITGEIDAFIVYTAITERSSNIGYIFSDSRNRAATYSYWNATVSAQDQAILDSISALFASYSIGAKTYSQVAADFAAKATSLISYYNSLTWTDTTGEVSGGALYTMQASTDQWKSWLDQNPSKQDQGPQFLIQVIQADGVGYLAGWVNAVIDEYSQNGRLDINNQGKRMGKGAQMAITISTGFWLRKFWG